MSVYFEGNAFIDGGRVQNAVVQSSSIGNCTITTSSLDMNLANITSVKDPINPQDAATKKYVDDLGIIITNVSLTSTNNSLVTSFSKGSYRVFVENIVINGPSAVFDITKNETSRSAHIVRTAATPGYMTDTTLRLSWPPNDGLYLRKTNNGFDGAYRVKII